VRAAPLIRQLVPAGGELAGDAELEEFYRLPAGPHLRLNFITSLDGAIEIDGRSAPLGGPADRAAFMAMRAVADVVMVGAGTARAEDYGPVRLSDGASRRRQEREQRGLPPLAVVSGRADLDPSARLFGPGSQVLVLTSAAAARLRPDLGRVAEVVHCGETAVDLGAAVGELRARGLGRILCEGGPALTAGLLAGRLVDELCLTISPLVAGPPHRHLTGEEPLGAPERFCLSGLLEAGGLLLTRYAPAGER
jgi:riboflavin biosynthesis pyrimidine reductase